MRRVSVDLPIITIDKDLTKSTAESNRREVSPVGEAFQVRTPLRTDLPRLLLPRFTKMAKPKEKELLGIDYETPLEDLIQPKQGLVDDQATIEAWFREHYVKMQRPSHYVGHEANCTVGETWVEVNRGLHRIDSLVPPEAKAGYHPITFIKGLAVTDQGESVISQGFTQPNPVETVKVTTVFRFEIEGTPCHRVRNREYEWQDLGDTDPGDFLVVQLGSLWPQEDVTILRHVNHRRVNASSVLLELPERLTEDWAELLGWWTAEGSYQDRSLRFTVNTQEKGHFLSLLDRLSLPYSTNQEKGKDCHWVLIHSASLTDAFREVLNLEGGAVNKHVPWPVLQGTQRIVRAYLSGLASGDGNASPRGQLRHRTSSARLACEVQQLWRRLGVPAGRSSSEDRRTVINGVELKNPITTSWCVQTCKPWTPVVARLLSLVPHKQERLTDSRYVDFPETKEDLHRQFNRIRLKDWDGSKVMEGGICGHIYLKVRTKEIGSEPVFDLCVPENHTYIANGFVSHNTDEPHLADDADLRVLIVRLSAYDSVNGSLTHGALAQLARAAPSDHNDPWSIFVDHAYMPGITRDATYLSEYKIPWLFGRTSKLPPSQFDVIFFTFALTMEQWNVVPCLINSGISPFKDQRRITVNRDAPYEDRDPVIVFGGVASDFLELLYGGVENHGPVCDGTVIGDGEYTVSLILNALYNTKANGQNTKDFTRAGHDLSKPEHFEKEPREGERWSWWYEPDCYEHVYEVAEDPTRWTLWNIIKDPVTKQVLHEAEEPQETRYNELREIKRKEGCEHVVEPGRLKRAVMRDLNAAPPFVQTPVLYEGSLGPSVDTQISSGCWVGESRVLTSGGYIKIRDLAGESHLGILTEYGPRSYGGVVYQGTKPTVRVTTQFKSEWEVSTDHRFKVMAPEGVIDWKYARDLREGDFVLCRRGDSGLLPEDRGWGVDMAYLAGCLYGDGSMHPDGSFYVVVPEHEEEMKDRLTLIGDKNSCPITWTWYSHEDRKDEVERTQGWWSGHLRVPLFEKSFPSYQTEGRWRAYVPESLWRCGKRQISSFLGGLATTDGYVGQDGNVRWSTRHKNLALEIKRLASLLGILTNYDFRSRPNPLSPGNMMDEYVVRVVGRDSNDRAKAIAFGLSHKEEVRQERSSRKRRMDKTVGFPYGTELVRSSFAETPSAKNTDLPARSFRESVRRLKDGVSPFLPASLMRRMMAYVETNPDYSEEELSQEIRDFMDYEWHFERVVKAELTGKYEAVFDPINVRETHSYVAEGAVSHNCLCVTGDTKIETEFGIQKIEDAFLDQEDADFEGGMIQTRQGMQSFEKIVDAGVKSVYVYTFRTEDGNHKFQIECTQEHRLARADEGDTETDWVETGDLDIGAVVWAVDPVRYQNCLVKGGRANDEDQHYYSEQVSVELIHVATSGQKRCYDIAHCEVSEYIADGIITHNSGGLCSFCVAEGTEVSVAGENIKIEDLCPEGRPLQIDKSEDYNFEVPSNDLDFDTPWGLQNAQGVVCMGKKECVKITTKRGSEIIVTPDHEILTHRDGDFIMIQARSLKVCEDFAIMSQTVNDIYVDKKSPDRDFLYPALLRKKANRNAPRRLTMQFEVGKDCQGIEGFEDTVSTHTEASEAQIEKQRPWLRGLRGYNCYADVIVKIEPAGVHKVYDVWNIPKGHAYFANGFVVSNCFAPDTNVVLADGSLKNISQIEPGTLVVTPRGKIRPVTKVFDRMLIEEEIGVLLTEGMDTPLRVTLNHKMPYMTLDKYHNLQIWVSSQFYDIEIDWTDLIDTPVEEMEVGGWVTGPESTAQRPVMRKIISLEREEYTGKVHNLEVGDHEHSYRVGDTPIPPEVAELWDAMADDPELQARVLKELND